MAAMQAPQRSAVSAAVTEQEEEEESCGPMPIRKLEVTSNLFRFYFIAFINQ